MTSDLVLAGLNFANNLSANFDIFHRLELSKFAAIAGLSAVVNRQVSSAKKTII